MLFACSTFILLSAARGTWKTTTIIVTICFFFIFTFMVTELHLHAKYHMFFCCRWMMDGLFPSLTPSWKCTHILVRRHAFQLPPYPIKLTTKVNCHSALAEITTMNGVVWS